MKFSYALVAILIYTLVLSGISAAIASPIAHADRGNSPVASSYVETFEFEVAEDRTRVVADTTNAYGLGLPAETSSFVTYGYIYPPGTLQGGNGILSNGEPEFPDLVIGKWTRRVYIVGSVLSRQTYDLGAELGNVTLVSEGYDTANELGVITQAITGGEGEYRNARGESRQELVGFNSTGGVNLRLMLNANVQ